MDLILKDCLILRTHWWWHNWHDTVLGLRLETVSS